jgi:hypothetical protein
MNDNARADEEQETTALPAPRNRIDEDTLDQLCSLAGHEKVYAKLTTAGFALNTDPDSPVPTLRGIITNAKPGYIRFGGQGEMPEKLDLDEMTPEEAEAEGFDLRLDLELQVNGTLVGLSLPKSSAMRFSRYTQWLRGAGLNPSDVATELKAVKATNRHGTFAVCTFTAVERLGDQNEVPF